MTKSFANITKTSRVWRKVGLKKLCAFWNVNKWDTDGCTLLEDSFNKSVATCSCNHLTNFALIMGDRPNDKDHGDMLSKILGGISCVLLIITQFCKHFIR